MHAIQALKVNKITACLLLSHKHFIEAYLDTESYISKIEYQPDTKTENHYLLPVFVYIYIKKE